MSDLVRISITIPRSLVKDLKNDIKNISKYITDAVIERREKEKADKAWKEFMKLPPTFTDIEDPVKYIEDLRKGDEERMKRLGI